MPEEQINPIAPPELGRIQGLSLPGPISLVMLVHNEAEIIEQVVREYHQEIISRLPGSEFIIVEDGSRDGTTEILQRLCGELGITVVHRNERRGYTRAMKDALSLPKHDIICFSDGDGQHDPRDFWRLAKRIPYCDLVIGFKLPRRDPFYRLVISRVFNVLIGLVFKLWLRDINSGFRLMRRHLVDDVLREDWQLNACIAAELALRAYYKGYAITEVPVGHLRRPFGKSKGLPLRKMPSAIVHVVREFVIMKMKINAGQF